MTVIHTAQLLGPGLAVTTRPSNTIMGSLPSPVANLCMTALAIACWEQWGSAATESTRTRMSPRRPLRTQVFASHRSGSGRLGDYIAAGSSVRAFSHGLRIVGSQRTLDTSSGRDLQHTTIANRSRMRAKPGSSHAYFSAGWLNSPVGRPSMLRSFSLCW